MAREKSPEKLREMRIKAERTRLLTLLGAPQLAKKGTANQVDGVPPDLQACLGLVDQAANLRVVLEDLAEDIRLNGTTELFCQSDKQEPYTRERPQSAIYSKQLTVYTKVVRQLTELLPKSAQAGAGTPGAELLSFVANGF